MKETNQVNILIADDHPLFLKGLYEAIEETSDWIVVAEAHDGGEALRLITERLPDIAILDINMPVKDGLEVAKNVFDKQLPTSIIILTMYDDLLLLNRAASYGVKGFILKESAAEDIVDGIASVVQGETFVSPRLSNRILSQNRAQKPMYDMLGFQLTRMEKKVIRLIAENNTTKTIAKTLSTSPKTVENHRSNICRKLNLSGKNALLHYVLENREALLRSLTHD